MKENLVYGKNPVREALTANQPFVKIYIHGARKHSSIVELARKSGIPVREVDRKKLSELAGHDQHQNVVGILSEFSYATIEDILQVSKRKAESPLIAILDEIQDPHNFGAIIRSADCFGLHGIIVPKNRAVGLNATVAKTSAGAISHVKITRVTNLATTIEQLKSHGIWIAGADQNARKNIDELDFQLPLGLVIGSEAKGIRRLVKEKCDFLFRIQMFGNINSLNASVAAAIMFWEIRKQRLHTPT